MDNLVFNIDNHTVGGSNQCFIIAEAGINHDGDITKAKRLVDIAIMAKADAVKFQSFNASRLASKDAILAKYHKKGLLSKNESLKELLARLEMNKQAHIELFKYARNKGITIFSTPFDKESVDLLEYLNVPVYKIASFSLTNYPLLSYIAEKQKPIIMSTGLHSLGEIEDAVSTIINTGNKNLALLQCTSHYPSKPEDANLRVMETYKSAFNVVVGYSDHTMGINTTIASVALGAKIVEKHYTLDIDSYGVDHDASLGPDELGQLIKGIREVEKAIGCSEKVIPECEKEIQRVHRPSLVAKVDIKKGETINESMISIKKPGTGIHPKDINWVIGRVVKNDISADRIILKSDLV